MKNKRNCCILLELFHHYMATDFFFLHRGGMFRHSWVIASTEASNIMSRVSPFGGCLSGFLLNERLFQELF